MVLELLFGWQLASHSTNGQLQGLNSSAATASHRDVAAEGSREQFRERFEEFGGMLSGRVLFNSPSMHGVPSPQTAAK